MPRYLQSILVFVAILVALNFIFKEYDYGVHISVVGSIVLTIVVSLLMNMFAGNRR